MHWRQRVLPDVGAERTRAPKSTPQYSSLKPRRTSQTGRSRYVLPTKQRPSHMLSPLDAPAACQSMVSVAGASSRGT
ncbi:hypothetical protein B0H19DRAFT_1155225 [Mycena capillaripes]|nr:hypothetical protein B0H19DRAFT_1155225 [Mycena capillaripes]